MMNNKLIIYLYLILATMLAVVLFYVRWWLPAYKGKGKFSGELSFGDSGSNVLRLQMALNSWRDYRIKYKYKPDSYPEDKLVLDGRFGDKTLDALIKCTGQTSIDYERLRDIEIVSKS